MKVSRLSLVGGALAVAALAVAQQRLEPGSYQITIEMALPGAPTPFSMTQTECLTPDEAGDIRSVLQDAMQSDDSCKYSDPVVRGNTMAWEAVCEGITTKSEMTFTGDGFSGTSTSVIDGSSLTAKFAAKRVGACSASSE